MMARFSAEAAVEMLLVLSLDLPEMQAQEHPRKDDTDRRAWEHVALGGSDVDSVPGTGSKICKVCEPAPV